MQADAMKQRSSTQVPEVLPYFDKDTNTFSYIVRDPSSNACAIVDSVLGFDYASGGTNTTEADAMIDYINDNDLQLEWIIETHVHADHLTAAPYIQEKLGGKIGIGEHVITVQETFGKIFNEGPGFQRDGSQFDHLFKDNETYQIGNLQGLAMHTPGHTPACMTHLIGDAAFVGDTLFMPDSGTARADFPGGDAGVLYESIQRILALPPETRVFMCHDYEEEKRDLDYLTSVAEEKASNIHVNETVSKEGFVEMREARDRTLDMPHLILPSLQVNMRAGHLPAAEDNGIVYLKVPLDCFK